MAMIRPRRSMLFVPGANARALEKARDIPADAFILDLEDSVSLANKETARAAIADYLAGEREVITLVRVNPLDGHMTAADVAAIIGIEVGTIPHVRIPRLAEGGMVSKRPGGIIANIGEGRYDEVVMPLSPEVLGQLGGGSGLRSGDTLRLAVGDREFTGYVDERADGRAAARGSQVSSAIRNRRWADA